MHFSLKGDHRNLFYWDERTGQRELMFKDCFCLQYSSILSCAGPTKIYHRENTPELCTCPMPNNELTEFMNYWENLSTANFSEKPYLPFGFALKSRLVSEESISMSNNKRSNKRTG